MTRTPRFFPVCNSANCCCSLVPVQHGVPIHSATGASADKLSAVPIKIYWVCDVCDARGEVNAELLVERLEDLTIEVAADEAITALAA